MAKTTSIYFVADIHGSEVCWRKFLNAARFYGVETIVVGGDVTGKALVPVVERRDGRFDAVERARVDGANERGALDQLVAGGGEEAAARGEAEGVARAADALQERRDGAGRADLADEVDGADVDA